MKVEITLIEHNGKSYFQLTPLDAPGKALLPTDKFDPDFVQDITKIWELDVSSHS